MTARRPVIAVIGDGLVAPQSPAWTAAFDVGRNLVDHAFRVATGGLGGVMEAACQGARSSTSYRSGDTIGILPGDSPDDANPFVDIPLPTGLHMARNTVVAHSQAVIAIGGGAGTLSEIAAAWILGRLVVALRLPGWSGRLADHPLDHRIRYPQIPDDRVYGADTAAEAVELVRDLLPRYAS